MCKSWRCTHRVVHTHGLHEQSFKSLTNIPRAGILLWLLSIRKMSSENVLSELRAILVCKDKHSQSVHYTLNAACTLQWCMYAVQLQTCRHVNVNVNVDVNVPSVYIYMHHASKHMHGAWAVTFNWTFVNILVEFVLRIVGTKTACCKDCVRHSIKP
jgi:hypothetical protein